MTSYGNQTLIEGEGTMGKNEINILAVLPDHA